MRNWIERLLNIKKCWNAQTLMKLALIKKSNLLLCSIYLVNHEKQQASVSLKKTPRGNLNKEKTETRFLSKCSPGSDILSLQPRRESAPESELHQIVSQKIWSLQFTKDSQKPLNFPELLVKPTTLIPSKTLNSAVSLTDFSQIGPTTKWKLNSATAFDLMKLFYPLWARRMYHRET